MHGQELKKRIDLLKKIRSEPLVDVIDGILVHLHTLPGSSEKTGLMSQLEYKMEEENSENRTVSEYRNVHYNKYNEFMKLVDQAINDFGYKLK